MYAITYKRCYPVHSTNITNPQYETIYKGTNSSNRTIINILLFYDRNTINITYNIMQSIKLNYRKKYGYTPTTIEIITMYTNGSLPVTDEQENILSAYNSNL